MNFRCKFRVAILFLFVCNWGVRVVLTDDDENINVKDVLHTIFGTIRSSDRMEVAPSNATGQNNFAEDSVQQSVENIPQHLSVLTIDSTFLNNARAGHMYLAGCASTHFRGSCSITAERFHRNIELETRGLMPPFDLSAGHDDRFHTGYDPPGVQWSNSHFQNLVNACGSSDGKEDAPSYAAGEDYYAHQPVSEDPVPEDLWSFWSRSPWSTSTATEMIRETMTPPSSFDMDHADRDADEQIVSPRFFTFQDLPDVPVSASDGTQSGVLSNVTCTVGDQLRDQNKSERS